jgi:hypothetical protein
VEVVAASQVTQLANMSTNMPLDYIAEGGGTLPELKSISGHTKTSTLARYLHTSERSRRAAIGALDPFAVGFLSQTSVETERTEQTVSSEGGAKSEKHSSNG